MTSISTLGQARDQIERLKTLNFQLATFQTQLASGKKTNLFKGLDGDVVRSSRDRANIKKLDTYSSNISLADRRINMMNSALQGISKQAGNIVASMTVQTQEGDLELGSIGALSGNTLDFIMDLVNTKDGDRYLFAGTDSLNQPLNDSGTLDTYVETQIDNWINGTITTDQLIDSYRDTAQLTDTTADYSAQLANGTTKSVFVRVDETSELDYTVRANDQGLRDIVVAAKMMKILSVRLDKISLDAGDPPTTVTAPGATQQDQNGNFFEVFNDLIAMFNGAIDRVDTLQTDIGNVQAKISEIGDDYRVQKNVLQSSIGDVEGVDINELAIKISSLQTQLQASYQVAAFARDLSLVNFIR